MAESQEMASFTDDESSQDIQKVSLEEKSEIEDPILSAINRIEKIDEDSNFGPVDTDHFNIESQNPPSRKESKDSDSDSDSDSDQSDGSDSDTDNEKEKIAFNFQQAKHPESDSDKSDDEPVRIIRGAAPPQFQTGDYESELLNKSSSSQISPKGKKLNNRDIRQQKQAEFFEAKAESARLRRETDVQLPRHEKTLTLDDLQGEKQNKEKMNKMAEIRQRKKEKLLALVGNKAPTMGQGFLDMNPSLKKLQDKLIKHTAPSKRSPKKKLKITETVKDENGEIIDVKEIVIEQPVKEEKPLFVHSGKKSKLKLLKESLMTKLKENRIERFKEEKSEYEADIRNDEENYLNDDLEKVDEEEAVASEDSSSDDSDVQSENEQEVEKDQSEADSESDKEYDSDDEIGKVKRRKKKKKANNFSDSEDDENEDIPQPFSNQESMASSINPYRNMSRLESRKEERNAPVTPDQTSRSSRDDQSASPYSDFKLNFDLDDSISRFPDETTNQSHHSNAKTELFPPDDDGDDAQNIDESQFKRAVGLTDHSQSQNPSTQDIHNLDWTQTQPTNEMSTDEMPSKSEMPVKQENELESSKNEAEEPAEEPAEELAEEPEEEPEENDSLEKQPAMSDDDINLESVEENDDPIIIKKKKKPIKKKSGLKMTQFEDIKEAEFDAEADLANVSGDEDETGADEYEHEEITEVLPSQRKMEKELKVIHNKLARDADAEELERVQSAFVGDEIDNAQRNKKRYRWILSNEFEGAAEKDSSDEDEPPSVEIQLKIEQEKLREKLEREKMLKESNFNEIGSFEFKTEPKPVMKSSSNIMSKTKLLLKSNKSKRKDRLALAISDLKPSSVSKSMAFTSNDSNRRKRNSDGFQNSASKKQKVPLLDKKKSLFLEID